MSQPTASVFVSYSHADKPLARALAAGLGARGFRVWIDEGELRVGDSLVERISEALGGVDFVVALVSSASTKSNWCRKEIALAMTGEIKKQGVTVMPVRVDGAKLPDTLADKVYLDVDAGDMAGAVAALARDIDRHLNPPDPLPPRRRAAARPDPARVNTARESTEATFEPVKLTGIDTAGVQLPRNDGSRGSALYAVPFVLSRVPEARWSQLLVQNWDRPPIFTTMHRPGIARVSGDRVVLNGTTLEEVDSYHLATLKLAVAEANKHFAALVEREQRERLAREAAAEEHQRQVEETAARLRFDD